MRDTRSQRNMAIVGITAAVGAIIGQMFIQPFLEKRLK